MNVNPKIKTEFLSVRVSPETKRWIKKEAARLDLTTSDMVDGMIQELRTAKRKRRTMMLEKVS